MHLCVVLSKEGVTQGVLLAVVLHGVGLLPLVRILKILLRLHQPWHADDVGAGGRFPKICSKDLAPL
jgi:hypothetical protein